MRKPGGSDSGERGVRGVGILIRNPEDKATLAAWIGLGVVIGTAIVGLALTNIAGKSVNAILLVLFLIYLFWLLDHVIGASDFARKSYRGWQERRFYQNRVSTVIQNRIHTIMEELQILTSAQGSIEKVGEKFFERPATPNYPLTNHPLLADVLPDFIEVRNILLQDKDLIALSFRRLDDLDSDLMHEMRISLDALSRFVNCYIAWIVKVMAVIAKHKGTCPSQYYAESAQQYAILQKNFLQFVADLDSLTAAYNNAASTDASVYSEFSLALSRRTLDSFP